MQGFHGAYLKVSLEQAAAETLPLSDQVLRECIGGVGLGSWLLLREGQGDYDPLAPESVLVFAFAPLVGTALNTSAKVAVLGKSPLTRRLNDAMLSSTFAISGKGTGRDALVITGVCPEWSVLFIDPEGMRLEPCPQQWLGLSAAETEGALKAAHGDDWQVAAIGVAGENLVPYALLSHDGRHAGRGGHGALLGSKKLKAIAVRGQLPTAIADETRFAAIQAQLKTSSLGHGTEKYRSTGTLGNLLVFNRLDILPTRNFQAGSDPRALGLSAEHLFTHKKVQRATCADCMIGCEKRISAQAGGSVRLEYENIFALGAMLDIWDIDAVLEASRLCDYYGLDSITTGGTLAFVMECTQRGIAGLPPLRFGDATLLCEAIAKIAHREDYGALLALGSSALADRIGQGTRAWAVQVKGLELPGYHPAHLQTLGLGLAVGARGADHNKSGAYDLDLSGTVERFALDTFRIEEMISIEDQAALMDSLILCKFMRRGMDDLFSAAADILTALTGEVFGTEQLRRSAQNIHHLKKLFNSRQGWRMEEDTLPPRFFIPSLQEGELANDGAREENAGIDPQAFHAARECYYLQRGWDAWGRYSTGEGLLHALELA